MSTNGHQNNAIMSSANAADKGFPAATMREGLEALQREYDAFRESSFQTLALISDWRIRTK